MWVFDPAPSDTGRLVPFLNAVRTNACGSPPHTGGLGSAIAVSRRADRCDVAWGSILRLYICNPKTNSGDSPKMASTLAPRTAELGLKSRNPRALNQKPFANALNHMVSIRSKTKEGARIPTPDSEDIAE